MNRLKKVLFAAAIFAVLFAGSAAGGAAFQAVGAFRVVGDVNVYDNDPFSDWNTAVGESPRIQLDADAGDIILEGATQDAFETIIADTDVSQDVTIDYPDAASGSITVGDFAVYMAYGPTVADHVDSIFFIADRAYTVTDIDVVWGTAESTGSMDVMLERLQGTEACGSGDDLQTAVVDATGTADTVASATLTATTANLDLAAGNRLCIDLTATPNEITELTVVVGLRVN